MEENKLFNYLIFFELSNQRRKNPGVVFKTSMRDTTQVQLTTILIHVNRLKIKNIGGTGGFNKKTGNINRVIGEGILFLLGAHDQRGRNDEASDINLPEHSLCRDIKKPCRGKLLLSKLNSKRPSSPKREKVNNGAPKSELTGGANSRGLFHLPTQQKRNQSFAAFQRREFNTVFRTTKQTRPDKAIPVLGHNKQRCLTSSKKI